MRYTTTICFIVLLPLALGLFSCSSTRHVPEGEYLLKRYKIKTDNKNIEKSEIKKYIRQKPNQRFLGLSFPFFLYNLSNPYKEKGINKWLRKAGEAPVVWDRFMMKESARQINNYLEKQGYYDAQVTDSAIFHDHKVTVLYNLDTEKPYRISNVEYQVRDSALEPFIFPDTSRLPVNPGNIFSVELLQRQRNMIETILRNKGFYRFSKDFVNYIADTTARKNKVDLTVEVNPFPVREEDGDELITRSHKRYRIDSIYIFPDYDPKEAIADKQEYIESLDTLEHKHLKFVYRGEPGFDLDVITQSNYLEPGEWYSQDETDKTYQHLNSLRLFQIINIKFNESASSVDSLVGKLDCHIYLKKFKLQSYTIELEGTNSSGNIGGAGNLVYTHKSIFGGAEQFQSKFTGAFEILDQDEFKIDNTLRLGTELSIDFPKFLLPFLRSDRFVKEYNPKTTLSAMYNYQERPDYTRTLANLTFGYRWQNRNYLTHYVNPIELNVLRLPYISDNFRRNLEEIYLKSSYDDHFLSVTSYSMIYNNQEMKSKTRDFQYFRLNAEVAGNILTGISKIVDMNQVGDHYELFGIRFAQFFKLDFDIRHYQILNENERFVYRFFVGGGFPYGNSSALPFVKQYFSGGANSIRAWNVRALGPGSYRPREDFTGYPNLTGDLKLELNWEYRFKMFWLLEGAFFVDAGNIWSVNPADDRVGAQFAPDDFLDQIALGTGLGLRFDLSFSVLRLDMGLKMKDPSYPSGERWLPGNRSINQENISWNIAIGYPF
ncbi:MAG: BamA/TamA family outer membrane protein [Bacteroidales bacterium]|nr:BamA/TamA family outer membrane protein [Bacteroidales bacterium]